MYSHEVGLAKPDPAIFLLTCDRLGVEPAETVLVDDVSTNVKSAAAVGLLAVLRQRTSDTIAAVDRLTAQPLRKI